MSDSGVILIVTGEPELHLQLGGHLEAGGYAVRFAASGDDAVQSAAESAADLVLLDAGSAGINAVDICRRFHGDGATGRLPVLFIGGAGALQDKLDAFEAGCVDYVAAPVHEAEVLARVRIHLKLGMVETLKREVDERTQAERKLVARERFLRTLTDHLPGMVGYWTDELRCGFANRAYLEWFGRSQEQMLGIAIQELMGEELFRKNEPHIRKALQGEMQHFERTLVKSDGSTGYTWAHYIPDVIDGAVRGFYVLVADVTELKRAEEMLRDSEAHFRTLVNTIPDLIWLKDADGVYLSCNAMFERFFGAREADIVGRTDYDFVSKELADFFREHDRNAMSAGRPTINEEWITFADDGRRALLETTKTPMLDSGGRVVGVLGIGHDITRRKQAEDEKVKLESQLHQAQKMDSIGRLAGGVAHDFNNMLSVILGHSELGLMHLDPAHPLCADLKVIRNSAERSADLTRQLLAFARKQTIAPKVMDLNETVSGMLKILQRLIGEDIYLNWQPAPALWKIKADPSQIDQILANLCVNARDAIKDTGRISIETRNNTIDARYCIDNPDAVPGEYVHLCVTDDGCGFDAETAAHIFEPFFTTKDSGEGTGLGLATVYGIVKQNNGFITVRSEPGRGTSFTVHFPSIEDREQQSLFETKIVPLPKGQETIILVEDEPAILGIAAAMLEKQGYNVLKAVTPHEAVRIADEHAGDIHLLITDVIMPEMNGRQLANRIMPGHPKMKLIFISGYTADIIAPHGVLDDGVNFIQKPFSLPVLSTRVREVLDGK